MSKMTKRVLLLGVVLSILLLCACDGDIPYYHHETSDAVSAESEQDELLPRFVFGEKGLYDVENDIEYVLLEGYAAKTIGEKYAEDATHCFYLVEQEHYTYFLCDKDGRVYKNTMMAMAATGESDSFAELYPGLKVVGNEG